MYVISRKLFCLQRFLKRKFSVNLKVCSYQHFISQYFDCHLAFIPLCCLKFFLTFSNLVMSFVTYILIAGLVMGTQDRYIVQYNVELFAHLFMSCKRIFLVSSLTMVFVHDPV